MKKIKIKELIKQVRGVSYKPEDLHNGLNEDSVILLRANNIDDGKINFDDDGLPITTKEDSSYHGYGVKSIYLIVDKYNGNVSFKEKNNMFSLNILIPLEN